MNNFKTQQGNTFYGLLIGIVLAALIIASILWYLNNNKTSFQTYTPPDPIPSIPDTLSHINNGQGQETNNTDEFFNDFTIDQATVYSDNVEQNTIASPKDDIEVLISAIRTPEKTHSESKNQPIKNSNNTSMNSQAQRTPEQILNNKTAKPIKNNKSKFVVQMGSFTKPEQAEKRKAELSLLNINANIEQSEINGQPVYRIRSSSLNQEDANKLQNTLKNNQVDNILIPSN